MCGKMKELCAKKPADLDAKLIVENVLNEGDLAIVDGSVKIMKGDHEKDKGQYVSYSY